MRIADDSGLGDVIILEDWRGHDVMAGSRLDFSSCDDWAYIRSGMAKVKTAVLGGERLLVHLESSLWVTVPAAAIGDSVRVAPSQVAAAERVAASTPVTLSSLRAAAYVPPSKLDFDRPYSLARDEELQRNLEKLTGGAIDKMFMFGVNRTLDAGREHGVRANLASVESAVEQLAAHFGVDRTTQPKPDVAALRAYAEQNEAWRCAKRLERASNPLVAVGLEPSRFGQVDLTARYVDDLETRVRELEATLAAVQVPMRDDSERQRANRLADECGAMLARAEHAERERDAAQAELLRRGRR